MISAGPYPSWRRSRWSDEPGLVRRRAMPNRMRCAIRGRYVLLSRCELLEERKLGALSLVHWLVVLLVVLIVLGAGKFPRLMHDLGEGIKNFRASLSDAGEPRVSVLTNAIPEDRTPADGR